MAEAPVVENVARQAKKIWISTLVDARGETKVMKLLLEENRESSSHN
jgi:hypothetical protein